jgi:hypothetical protein
MAHFVGLDVSVKETSVCVVDDTGKVICERKVPTEPDDIVVLLTSVGGDYVRVGISAALPPPARASKKIDPRRFFLPHHGAATCRPLREARTPCGDLELGRTSRFSVDRALCRFPSPLPPRSS